MAWISVLRKLKIYPISVTGESRNCRPLHPVSSGLACFVVRDMLS